MHKIGLKLWSTNLQYIQDAVKLYDKGYYEYIELYVEPNTYAHVGSEWKKLNIPFIIHAPHFSHNMCLSRKTYYSNNIKLIEETKKFADLLNCEIIILHPGIDGDIEETLRQLSIINDSRICVENKPYYLLNAGKGTIHSPEQMKYTIENAKVGFCYDIGHGMCSSNARKKDFIQEMDEYLELSPQMFHLTDGDINGIYDQHLHLTDGNFDFKKIVQKIPLKSKITLETYKNHKTHLNDFKKDCAYFSALFSNNEVAFKLADFRHIKEVYEYANDSVARKYSFSTTAIIFKEHQKWFAKRITSKKCFFLILKDKQFNSMGYIRLDERKKNIWEISISLSNKYRNKKIGFKAIRYVSCLFTNLFKQRSIIARIKKENNISIKCFCNANYKILKKTDYYELMFSQTRLLK